MNCYLSENEIRGVSLPSSSSFFFFLIATIISMAIIIATISSHIMLVRLTWLLFISINTAIMPESFLLWIISRITGDTFPSVTSLYYFCVTHGILQRVMSFSLIPSDEEYLCSYLFLTCTQP